MSPPLIACQLRNSKFLKNSITLVYILYYIENPKFSVGKHHVTKWFILFIHTHISKVYIYVICMGKYTAAGYLFDVISILCQQFGKKYDSLSSHGNFKTLNRIGSKVWLLLPKLQNVQGVPVHITAAISSTLHIFYYLLCCSSNSKRMHFLKILLARVKAS